MSQEGRTSFGKSLGHMEAGIENNGRRIAALEAKVDRLENEVATLKASKLTVYEKILLYGGGSAGIAGGGLTFLSG